MTRSPSDPVWDTLTDLFGEPRTQSERGRRNRAVKELHDAGASEQEIRWSYDYCKRFTDFTEMAVCAHLTKAVAAQQRQGDVRELFRRQAG